jgi:hypothetical protein
LRIDRLLKKGLSTLRQAQGERKNAMKLGRDPLMLSLSKHGAGLFNGLLCAMRSEDPRT